MDLQDALGFLYGRLPVYAHAGNSALGRGLGNITALCRYFGNPHKTFATLHVAGTNGKGTVSSSLAAILCQAGYKVGLYISPHLKNFSERISVNGEQIPAESLVDFVRTVQPMTNKLQASFFEVSVAMAFVHFAQATVDIAIIEVGLGGRWDATNIIVPLLSVITSISHDHQEVLGNTLAEIAHEKAGIIKRGVPVVLGGISPVLRAIFREEAARKESPIFLSDGYRIENVQQALFARTVNVYTSAGTCSHRGLTLPIPTDYYVRNLPVVLCAAERLCRLGYTVTPPTISSGITKMLTHVPLKGRWQRLSTAPILLCDIAHNVAALSLVMRQIQHFHTGPLYVVFGLSSLEKSVGAMWRCLPRSAYYFFTQARAFRSISADLLHKKAQACGLQGEVAEDVNTAIATAKARSTLQSLIFVCGSAYMVAEVEGL